MGGMGDMLRGAGDAKMEERRLVAQVKRIEKAAKKQPVAFARLMVAHAVVACEESRERAWAAAEREDTETFWTEGVRTAALCLMLCRMAGACGIPEGRWWDASEEDLVRFWADEERATAVVRAFVAEVRHRPDNAVLLAHLLIADPRVSARSKDRVAMETTGKVAATVKLVNIPALRTRLRRDGHDLLDVLPAAVCDALFRRQQGEGIKALRSNAINALRRQFEGEVPKIEHLARTYQPSPDEIQEFIAQEEIRSQLDGLERHAGLSPQQGEVWGRLRKGQSNSQIATALAIKPNHVYNVKKEALRKLRRAAGL